MLATKLGLFKKRFHNKLQNNDTCSPAVLHVLVLCGRLPKPPVIRQPSLKDRVQDEIRKYMMINTFPNSKPKGASTTSMPGLPARDVKALRPFDPLSWWQRQTLQFPLLADIARRIFVIPASSAKCEQHFSAFNARNVITTQRNAMNPETMQAISVVLESYKTGLL